MGGLTSTGLLLLTSHDEDDVEEEEELEEEERLKSEVRQNLDGFRMGCSGRDCGVSEASWDSF